ncbi:DUF397 domain-containing protein [Streptomyces sp. NBC_00536]|uniref:DUF397 domain-containing protein n=1 Tax=Streptomyces sp. NBC_00536 TaxID=2975769 RepID=UPI002E81E5C6|nr:DUF397 domain-containing protein [Streptomyces sp. NBC_00536]WUC83470.1 DUF397 domain-containing protein [Streptomyces sp. NBC_00536]
MTSKKTLHAFELTEAAWFKSSFSDGGEQCVEVADLRRTVHAGIAVRDSKHLNGPALLVGPPAFSAFIRSTRLTSTAA